MNNNLLNIWEQVKSFYNPMGIENEISTMKNLKTISTQSLQEQKEIFFNILDMLTISHVDDYYNVNEKNKADFLNFIIWLNNVKENFDIKDQEFIDSVADVLDADNG